MKVEHMPVTEKEQKNQLNPRVRALSEFYQALNDRDMKLMAPELAQLDEAVMDNPVGSINAIEKRSE
jgi:hypothetical protein